MADKKALAANSIHDAVQITIAAIPMQAAANQSASWISNPDQVAEFVEKIARKVEELRGH